MKRGRRRAEAVDERNPVFGVSGAVLPAGGNAGRAIQVELDGEEAAVWDLSPSREKVQELLASLIRGGVTPVALRDIVDDWLLE